MRKYKFNFFQMDNDQFEKRVRFLLHHLKKMSREMPSDLRQRVPYELLSSLAANLAQVILLIVGFI